MYFAYIQENDMITLDVAAFSRKLSPALSPSFWWYANWPTTILRFFYSALMSIWEKYKEEFLVAIEDNGWFLKQYGSIFIIFPTIIV